MPMLNIEDFQRKIFSLVRSCFLKQRCLAVMRGLCRGIFAAACYAIVQVFSPWTTRAAVPRQVPRQNSDALFLLPAPVKFQTGNGWSGLVWPGIGGVPVCWTLSRHGWEKASQDRNTTCRESGEWRGSLILLSPQRHSEWFSQ